MGVIEEDDKTKDSKLPMLVGLEPTRMTQIDSESIALTTRPHHLFIPFSQKICIINFYHNY